MTTRSRSSHHKSPSSPSSVLASPSRWTWKAGRQRDTLRAERCPADTSRRPLMTTPDTVLQLYRPSCSIETWWRTVPTGTGSCGRSTHRTHHRSCSPCTTGTMQPGQSACVEDCTAVRGRERGVQRRRRNENATNEPSYRPVIVNQRHPTLAHHCGRVH